MTYNTPEQPEDRKPNRRDRLARHVPNARQALGLQPKYAWPKPGDDLPRMTWVQYLELHAAEFAAAGSPPALALADAIRRLADEARRLRAWSPESHEELARLAEDAARELDYGPATEATWEDLAASWVPGPDPDETGGWDGHDDTLSFEELEDEAQRRAAEMN